MTPSTSFAAQQDPWLTPRTPRPPMSAGELLDHPNNARLRELVRQTGLKQASAITLFNRDRFRPVGLAIWNAWIARPGEPHWRALPDEALSHARAVFEEMAAA